MTIAVDLGHKATKKQNKNHAYSYQYIQMQSYPSIRSALCAASQLPEEGPTDVEDDPAPAC